MISLISMDRFCPRTSCSQCQKCQEWDITSGDLQNRIQDIAANLTKKETLEPSQIFAMSYDRGSTSIIGPVVSDLMLDVPSSAVHQLGLVLAQVRALQSFIESSAEDASEYRLGVASGAGQEYLVVAAISETLDMVAKMKREIEPDRARIRALREKVEKLEKERSVMEQEVLNCKILRSALQESREYSKVLTDERTALKQDLADLKALYRLSAETKEEQVLERLKARAQETEDLLHAARTQCQETERTYNTLLAETARALEREQEAALTRMRAEMEGERVQARAEQDAVRMQCAFQLKRADAKVKEAEARATGADGTIEELRRRIEEQERFAEEMQAAVDRLKANQARMEALIAAAPERERSLTRQLEAQAHELREAMARENLLKEHWHKLGSAYYETVVLLTRHVQSLETADREERSEIRARHQQESRGSLRTAESLRQALGKLRASVDEQLLEMKRRLFALSLKPMQLTETDAAQIRSLLDGQTLLADALQKNQEKTAQLEKEVQQLQAEREQLRQQVDALTEKLHVTRVDAAVTAGTSHEGDLTRGLRGLYLPPRLTQYENLPDSLGQLVAAYIREVEAGERRFLTALDREALDGPHPPLP